ncbi:hypothetical protein [Oryza sativa Japonica Group]|uniref:Uncharacterized protein n=1 Tax=Oryza sativa subsp. japonica TaxID=39947 RepID=Q8S0Y8_ORYSJ|nr:hypothetical protein [Oryza sativa Japonica Group]BAB93174.1 hypothetical protein [Oryza sativa Japonica Group]
MAYDGGIVCVWDAESNLEGVQIWFRRSNRHLTGGQTGDLLAVRPAKARRSDRRRRQELAIDLGGSTGVTTSVRPTISRRSDRRYYFGQTAIHRFRG